MTRVKIPEAFLRKTLLNHFWHKKKAAGFLQISRPTLDKYIKKYQIKKPKHHRNGKRK